MDCGYALLEREETKKVRHKAKANVVFRIYSVPGGDADSMVGRRILDDAGLS